MDIAEGILFLVDQDLVHLKQLSSSTIEAIKLQNFKPEVVAHISAKPFSDEKKIQLYRSIGADMAADFIYHATRN